MKDAVHVAIGSAASVELLPTLVQSPDRNYARALTSLQKWAPVRLHENVSDKGFEAAELILLIDLEPHKLPRVSDVIQWVESGKRVTILSSARLLTSPEAKLWLTELGFGTRTERSLVLEKDLSADMLGKRAPVLARNSFMRFFGLGLSPWIENESTQVGQIFSLRPSVYKAISATGSIGLFARSDQFSDAGIGEVWDGLPVDDLARVRESLLAQIVLGDKYSAAGQTDSYPQITVPTTKAKDSFPRRYIAVSGGKLQSEGVVKDSSLGAELSFAETPDAYIARIRNELSNFLQHCRIDITGYCNINFIDSKLIEWFVIPRINSAGEFIRVEIIHEGRLTGTRESLNVVFE
jgi:hypothetical protein